MIRVFASTQPGVLSMLALQPDSTDFAFRVQLTGRQFYLAKRGQGWVLYKPSVLTEAHLDARGLESLPYKPSVLANEQTPS